MRQIITALFFIVIISKSVRAQETVFSNRLWESEYRLWQAQQTNEEDEARWQVFEVYCMNGIDTSVALVDLAARLSVPLPSHVRAKQQCMNACLYYLRQGAMERAEAWWQASQAIRPDTLALAVFMCLLYTQEVPPFADSVWPDWRKVAVCMSLDTVSDVKHWMNASSRVVPGLGMVLKGYPRQGATALLLSAGTGWGVYALWKRKLYINAVGVASMFLFKFYGGNIRYTQQLKHRQRVRHRNELADACRVQLEQVWQTLGFNYQ
jgi:hypothetical protein